VIYDADAIILDESLNESLNKPLNESLNKSLDESQSPGRLGVSEAVFSDDTAASLYVR